MSKVIKLAICGGLLLCLLSCSGGSNSSGSEPSTNACNVLSLPTREFRIVNGTACDNLAQSPVVRVLLLNGSGIPVGLCTGTLVTSTSVISAAHCFRGHFTPVINYGDQGAARTVSVKQVHIHPNFELTSASALNDVAVVELSRPITDLPTLPVLASSDPQPGEIVSIFGYGTDENGQLEAGILQSGQMRITAINSDHIRADYNGVGSNTCTGDSGGPLIRGAGSQAAIAGITSTGSRTDCLAGDVSVFTNLSSAENLNFLADIIPTLPTR
ncbi:MAG: trypsin-like serine protease [Oligoflexia bacterium]|nr:trypsin-like serine protease [Oligoflexia bacterium]